MVGGGRLSRPMGVGRRWLGSTRLEDGVVVVERGQGEGLVLDTHWLRDHSRLVSGKTFKGC